MYVSYVTCLLNKKYQKKVPNIFYVSYFLFSDSTHDNAEHFRCRFTTADVCLNIKLCFGVYFFAFKFRGGAHSGAF